MPGAQRRLKKYLPSEGVQISEEKQPGSPITKTTYSWKGNPVQLVLWRHGPEIKRVDLRGLEQFPEQKQIDQALAFYHDMREQHRRDAGELSGPGRKTKWDKRLAPWKDSGYNSSVLAELRQEYLDEDPDHLLETFNRTARRWKRKWEQENT